MRASLLGRFLWRSVGWLLCWTLLWSVLADWLTAPLGVLAGGVMPALFPAWAESVARSGSTLTLFTSILVHDLPGMAPGQAAFLAPEVATMKYGYGLPLLLALLCASRPRHLAAKAVAGGAVMLGVQLWGVVFDWLRQVGIGQAGELFSPLQRELIAFGYQAGTLILPALLPLLLWLALDRRFLAALLLETALDVHAGPPAPAAALRDAARVSGRPPGE